MNIADIIELLLRYPDVPRPYEELKKYYLSIFKLEEADALSYLIEKKFENLHKNSCNS